MLKFKFNVGDALERIGMNQYQAKKTGILSQDTLKKIKKEDMNLSLETINRLCIILDTDPKSLLEYVENEEETAKLLKGFNKKG